MNSQQHFALMCAAMTGSDEWLEAIQDEIDSMPEDFVWDDCPHYAETVDLEENILDREFWSRGQW